MVNTPTTPNCQLVPALPSTMVNKRREVAKDVVVYKGWQALTLWEMVFPAMLQARRVGKTQPAMWQLIQSPVKMGQLIHLPTEKQLTLPQETREQLIQSPLKMGLLMRSPMKMEQLTLPQETRPN